MKLQIYKLKNREMFDSEFYTLIEIVSDEAIVLPWPLQEDSLMEFFPTSALVESHVVELSK